MRRKCLFLIVSIAVGLLFLSTAALATPLEGKYSTWAGTLQTGIWMEDFSGATPPGQMGVGNSILTAFSYSGSGQTNQWLVGMTSNPASAYGGGAPVNPHLQLTWDYQTPYIGSITIGGSLMEGGVGTDVFNFALGGATNYNVTFGKYKDVFGRPLLEWEFVACGYDANGVEMDVRAYYQGAPYQINGYVFGDLATVIQMEMEIKGKPVPEPATMLLLGSGLIGLAGFGRKKLFKKV